MYVSKTINVEYNEQEFSNPAGIPIYINVNGYIS